VFTTMDLDLRLLRSFIVLEQERHFGRAAHQLGISSPALSRQIQRLESQAGVPLLLRTTRTVELTAAGSAFLPEATKAVDHAARAVDLARAST
jgi:DNA-binding transcriptional LysR family regulator